MTATVVENGPVWLASFQKSGNTWLRLLLANLLLGAERPVDINRITLPGPNLLSRRVVDHLTLIDTSLLSASEVDGLRPQWTRIATAGATQRYYFKTHDCWRRNPSGEPVLGRQAGSAALYVVRDPRDVVVSLAHHFGCSLDRAIGYLNDGARASEEGASRYESRFDGAVYNWSLHVSSWLDQCDIALHFLRYEDLLSDTARVFGAAQAFLGYDRSPQAIERAVAFSSFEQLQEQEHTKGFRERFHHATAPFFRSGRAGGWTEVLSAAQQERIIVAHRPMMERLGYLQQISA